MKRKPIPLSSLPPPSSSSSPPVDFAELWVFNTDGQLVNIPGTPGTSIASTAAAWGGSVAGATDFQPGTSRGGFGFDPYDANLNTLYYHSGCAPTDYLAASFTSGAIAQYVYINRCAYGARSAFMSVQLKAGAAVTQSAQLTGACVQVRGLSG